MTDITNIVTSYNMSFIPLLRSHSECRKGKFQSNTRNSNKKQFWFQLMLYYYYF